MADIHHLPQPPLPEGWAPSTVFESEWVRDVRLGTAHAMLLYVYEKVDLGVFDALIDGEIVDRRPTLWEAIAAVELAYCGCRVRPHSDP